MPYKNLLLAYCRQLLLDAENSINNLQKSIFRHPREVAYELLKLAL